MSVYLVSFSVSSRIKDPLPTSRPRFVVATSNLMIIVIFHAHFQPSQMMMIFFNFLLNVLRFLYDFYCLLARWSWELWSFALDKAASLYISSTTVFLSSDSFPLAFPSFSFLFSSPPFSPFHAFTVLHLSHASWLQMKQLPLFGPPT